MPIAWGEYETLFNLAAAWYASETKGEGAENGKAKVNIKGIAEFFPYEGANYSNVEKFFRRLRARAEELSTEEGKARILEAFANGKEGNGPKTPKTPKTPKSTAKRAIKDEDMAEGTPTKKDNAKVSGSDEDGSSQTSSDSTSKASRTASVKEEDDEKAHASSAFSV